MRINFGSFPAQAMHPSGHSQTSHQTLPLCIAVALNCYYRLQRLLGSMQQGGGAQASVLHNNFCATKCEMAFVGAGRYPCDGHCGDHLHFFPGATENAQARSLLPLCTDSRLVHLNSCFWQGRAGVPMEVMGLMVGEFVDDYMVVVSSILPLAMWC